jgi:hypothetical protein
MGQTDEALALYEAHLKQALEQGMRPVEGVLLADRAWCRVRERQIDAARADAALAAASLASPGSHGDRAPGHSRLAQVCEALGDSLAAQQQQELAVERWAGHREDQRLWVDALNLALEKPAG